MESYLPVKLLLWQAIRADIHYFLFVEIYFPFLTMSFLPGGKYFPLTNNSIYYNSLRPFEKSAFVELFSTNGKEDRPFATLQCFD